MSDPRIGTELAGYRIEALIGSGGMGTVYLAEHSRLRRKVALKILAPDLARDVSFRARFERESRLAASLEHPNIVSVYDAGEVDGTAYIAMRYVDGPDLGTVLEEKGRREPARTVAIITQIASALDAAHARGLIHRDVKPGNILLEGEHAYLADFGITRSLGTSTALTETGRFVGTLDYAAPEQIEGGELDARTDEYALACVAFQCLTGTPPFKGDLLATVMHGHLEQTPPRASKLVADVPPALDEALANAMAKSKEDRYASCGAFADALAGVLATPPSEPAMAGPLRPRVRVIVGLVLLAAIAVVLVIRLGGGREPAPPPTNPSAAVGSPSATSSSLGNAVVSIDPVTLEVDDVIPMPQYPSSLAVGGQAVWVRVGQSRTSNQLRKLRSSQPDPAVVAPVRGVGLCEIQLPDNFDCVASEGDAIWSLGGSGAAARGLPLEVRRIDPSTNRVADSIEIATSGAPRDIALGGGAVWVSADGTTIYRAVPETGQVDAVATGGSVGSIAYGDGSVWVSDPLAGVLRRIDPVADEVAGSVPLPGSPEDLVVGDGYIWVTDYVDDEVVRVNTSLTSSLETFRVGDNPREIAFGAGAVWVADEGDQTVSRIDLSTGEVTSIDVGGRPGDIAVGDGRVWVTVTYGFSATA